MANANICIVNETELPLVCVIKRGVPLYSGVIQPGERVTWQTGRKVAFTVETYPYDGNNEPTTWQNVKGPLFIGLAAIATVATGGAAAPAVTGLGGAAGFGCTVGLTGLAMGGVAAAGTSTLEAAVIAAGTCGIAASAASKRSKKALGKVSIKTSSNHVAKSSHYANGDCIHVRGGPKRGVNHLDWKPMHFETDLGTDHLRGSNQTIEKDLE